MLDSRLSEFATAYSLHRQAEGRQLSEQELLSLPWLRHGPQAAQWAVRARTYEGFVRHVLGPRGKALTILDLGAGNGWLSHRVAELGHKAIALDIRADAIEGLGAGEIFAKRYSGRIERLTASFDSIPLPDGSVDLAVFNAALHYATNLTRVLGEAARVTRRGGKVVILDSPFYRSEAEGLAMQAEKQQLSSATFGAQASALMALPFIEFLTAERLAEASPLRWTRRRVRYPLSYELRPLIALVLRRRGPSRFDLWVAEIP